MSGNDGVVAISVIEADSEMGVYVVGVGGEPNSHGVVQCDAAMMDGNELRFGAVAALEGFVFLMFTAKGEGI